MQNQRKRVVVTGVGWVTPLGWDLEHAWRKMLDGQSGVRLTNRFESTSFPTKFSAESLDGVGANKTSLASISESVVTRFALAAVQDAWGMSGLTRPRNQLPNDDIGVYFAAGETCLPFELLQKHMSNAWRSGENSMDSRAWTQILDDLGPDQIAHLYPQHTLQVIAQSIGAGGYVSNCLTACAASLQAIGEATELIRMGEAQVMVAGGANSMLHPIGMSGFNRLGTLSTRNDQPQAASRPFDSNRDGFVMGEGAGAVVLESLEHAQGRNANILAEVLGYGSTSDAYRVTDQHPDSDGLVRAMLLALKDASVSASDVDYLNAHGTSTTENDKQETIAIHKVFGDCARHLPVSSIKSMIGHLLTAAGAVEFIATVLALRDQTLPPTINLLSVDPDCNLHHIANQSRQQTLKVAMKVNTGFGGLNDAVVLGRFDKAGAA